MSARNTGVGFILSPITLPTFHHRNEAKRLGMRSLPCFIRPTTKPPYWQVRNKSETIGVLHRWMRLSSFFQEVNLSFGEKTRNTKAGECFVTLLVRFCFFVEKLMSSAYAYVLWFKDLTPLLFMIRPCSIYARLCSNVLGFSSAV